MFPSAVTALAGAGRNRSPERAGRERARRGEREESGEGGGGRRVFGGLRGGEAAPGLRGSAGGGGVKTRDPQSSEKEASWEWGARWPHGESARRRRNEAGESRAVLRSGRPKAARWQD